MTMRSPSNLAKTVSLLGLLVASSTVAATSANMLDALSSLILPFDKNTHHGEAPTGLSLLPASPDCWLEAIRSLNIWSFPQDSFSNGMGDDGSRVLDSVTCGSLTSVDQKVLALELSKCHMKDLRRPLFHFNDAKEEEACVQGLADFRQVTTGNVGKKSPFPKSCLVHLTDAGFHTYTHFFSYVNQLCTRLLSEVVLGQYYDASRQLAHSSRRAELTFQTLIDQQDALFHRWNEREEHVMSMYDRLEAQSQGFDDKLDDLESRIEEEKEAWIHEYRRFQEAQREELQQHHNELKILTQVVRGLQWFMHPWTRGWAWLSSFEISRPNVRMSWPNIAGRLSNWKEWWMKRFSSFKLTLGEWALILQIGLRATLSTLKVSLNDGWNSLRESVQMSYYFFRSGVYTVGGLFCMCLVTVPPALRWMRRYMALTILVVQAMQIASAWIKLKDRDLVEDSDSDAWKWGPIFFQVTDTLNAWQLASHVIFYCLGFVISLICGCSKNRDGDDDESFYELVEENEHDLQDPLVPPAHDDASPPLNPVAAGSRLGSSTTTTWVSPDLRQTQNASNSGRRNIEHDSLRLGVRATVQTGPRIVRPMPQTITTTTASLKAAPTPVFQPLWHPASGSPWAPPYLNEATDATDPMKPSVEDRAASRGARASSTTLGPTMTCNATSSQMTQQTLPEYGGGAGALTNPKGIEKNPKKRSLSSSDSLVALSARNDALVDGDHEEDTEDKFEDALQEPTAKRTRRESEGDEMTMAVEEDKGEHNDDDV